MDYHSEVEETYRSTLDALRAAGLDAEMIDTGGSCKAIEVTGTNDDGAHLVLQRSYVLLTAGGPLDVERDPETTWEIGIYDREGDTVAIAETQGPWDRATEDQRLAEQVREIVWVLR